ncbi:ArnT family glycosyltransferase [Tundrisphaera sp. TA3]|uniref:ArnT family glycosyltransferase n=1 Tax=Tundrisphaera sp. TA3 TaxID=3435775 RepID=UPI003EBBE20D
MTSEPGPVKSTGSNALYISLALFLGSLLLTWGLVFATRTHFTPAMLDVDELEYYDFAGEFLQGRYDFNARRVAGYFIVLAGFRWVLGDQLLPLQLAVSFLFSLTTPLTYLLVRREFGSRGAALLAGLGVMTWPTFIRYGATLYSETFALPIFATTLLIFPGPTVTGRKRAWRWFWSGIMLAFCMHVRPMYLLFAPFGALLAYWRARGGKAGLLSAATLAAGCLLIVLPWSILISLREHSPVLLSNIGGETLAGGFNPELLRKERENDMDSVSPSGRVVSVHPGKWVTVSETGYLTPEETKLPYTLQTRLLAERAQAWMLSNPGATLYISFRKLTYMWGIYPFWNGWSQTLLGNLPLIGLLILACVSVFRLRRQYRGTAIFWILPLFVSAVTLVSWGSWRFREPGDLGLFALAAALPWARDVERFLAETWSAPTPPTPGAGESLAP